MTNISEQHRSVVFYADVLGFGQLATSSADEAADLLTRLAHLMSESGLARYIQHPAWCGRYGLSDSLFLVASSVDAALEAAAELMFNVAYLTRTDPILLRGAIAWGRSVETTPLFAKSAVANLVGPAVVDAVKAEAQKKGPRVTVTPSAITEISAATRRRWLVGDDLLWPLAAYPPDGAQMLRDLIDSVILWFRTASRDRIVLPHATSYLELLAGSVYRLAAEGNWATYSPSQQVLAASTELAETAPAIGPLLNSFFDATPGREVRADK